ncbi:MAG: hypothetical protein PHC70_00395 [Patescibacteria group bacterium]|nr:hypothetical protein [Patescibacteria group bacterium]
MWKIDDVRPGGIAITVSNSVCKVTFGLARVEFSMLLLHFQASASEDLVGKTVNLALDNPERAVKITAMLQFFRIYGTMYIEPTPDQVLEFVALSLAQGKIMDHSAIAKNAYASFFNEAGADETRFVKLEQSVSELSAGCSKLTRVDPDAHKLQGRRGQVVYCKLERVGYPDMYFFINKDYVISVAPYQNHPYDHLDT